MHEQDERALADLGVAQRHTLRGVGVTETDFVEYVNALLPVPSWSPDWPLSDYGWP